MTDDDRIFALIVVKIWYFTPAGCRWHCVATVQALREVFGPCLIFLWYFYNISKIFLQCFYNISRRQVALCGKSARFEGSFCPCLIFRWYFYNIFAIFLQCFYNISRRQVALCGKSARFWGKVSRVSLCVLLAATFSITQLLSSLGGVNNQVFDRQDREKHP